VRRLNFDERSLELADRLQAWDVLGVYVDEDNRPMDDEEYDDLVDPLRSWLESGASPGELSIRLVRLLRRDYGLDIEDDFAALTFTREVHDWWSGLE
jgi:hypothetical protein